jgi:predicted ATP-dependent serine protease
MNKSAQKNPAGKNKEKRSLPKALTGVLGLDEITGGGFPRGRATLICGSAGAGKTLLAMEFLVRGAMVDYADEAYLHFVVRVSLLFSAFPVPQGRD